MGRCRMVARLLVVVLAGALAVGGCSREPEQPSGPIDPAAAAKVASLRALPFEPGRVTVLADALRAAGVAVGEAGGGPVRVSDWQLQNMAVEAANGGGVRGDLLARVMPMPQGVPPIGYLVAAWATTYDSDGARLSYAILGERDFRRPERIVFPQAVLTLFLADATKDMASAPPAGSATALGQAVPEVELASSAAGPCSAASSFVQKAIASVAGLFKVKTSRGGLFGFLGKIWNAAVDLAAGLVTGLIESITQPVVNLISNVFGVLATIQQLSTFLHVWRATLTPDPPEARFGVDGQVVTGLVRLKVADNRLPIPETVLDCAAVFGVDLREAGSAAGSKLVWDPVNHGRPDLSATKTADAQLDKEQSATFTYRTGQEPAHLAAGGAEQERAGLLQLTAMVQRNDVERVRRLFTHLVFDQLPSSVRGIVESVARPVLDLATRHLAALTDVKSVVYVGIVYHAERPSPSPKNAAGGGPGCGVNGVAPGRYTDSREARQAPYTVASLDVLVGADGAVQGKVSIKDGAGLLETGWELGGTVTEPLLTRMLLLLPKPGDGPADVGEGAVERPVPAGGPMTGDCTHLDWTIPSPSYAPGAEQAAGMFADLFTGWHVPRRG